jgi:peptide-methionine (S)-S-oxide reductase
MHLYHLARAALFAVTFASAGALFAPSSEAQDDSKHAVATFAGGCFWSIEKAFDGKSGVISAVSGFMGGETKNPTYYQVAYGGTGHLEAVQVTYDPAKISYEKLLDIFWHDIDPTDPRGQFCDYGEQYTTAVFTHDAEQKKLAESSKAAVAAELKAEVTTAIRDASDFTAAGPEHQDFARTHSEHYHDYLVGCRREEKLRAVWGDKAHAKL